MSMLVLLASALLLQDLADIRVDVELVRIPAMVSDRKGLPAKDLKASDFTIRDNGIKRAVKYFARDTDLPLTIGLVVDLSGSQRRFAELHRRAMEQFFRQILRPDDRVFIVTLERDVRLVQDLTNSPQLLDAAVARLRPRAGVRLGVPCPVKEMFIGVNRSVLVSSCGGSVIWDGVYYAAEKLRKIDGRKALIVMTDGEDSGSPHNLQQAIGMAQTAETLVYSIKNVIRRKLSDTIKKPLEKLASETGGEVFDGDKHRASEAIFQKIQQELRTQYVLGFNAEGARDGAFHELKVGVPRGLKVRTRSGYWMRKE